MTEIEVLQEQVQVDLVVERVTDVEVYLEAVVAETVVEHVEVLVEGGQGLPGASAYDIAVRRGFVGSEDDWLVSIGGVPIYPAKTLVREDGQLVEVHLFADVEKTELAQVQRLVRLDGKLDSVEVRDPQGVLLKKKLLQRDAQGHLVGVAYADS